MLLSLLVKTIVNGVQKKQNADRWNWRKKSLVKYVKHKSNSEHNVPSPLINKECIKSTITTK